MLDVNIQPLFCLVFPLNGMPALDISVTDSSKHSFLCSWIFFGNISKQFFCILAFRITCLLYTSDAADD